MEKRTGLVLLCAWNESAPVQPEISKLPGGVTNPSQPYVGCQASLYQWRTHTNSQRLILILLQGSSQVKITHEAICLMQFPIESLMSPCINTLKHVVVTQNNDQPDWEQPHIPQS